MKHHNIPRPERAALEARCAELSKANGPRGRRFFIGLTADKHGSGHALIEVNSEGERVTHWGDASALHSILDGSTKTGK